MTTLVSYARVDADGRLSLQDELDLTAGEEFMVTIERVTPEQLAKEDEVWDRTFAQPGFLNSIVERGLREIEAGEAEDFDPDVDEL